MSTPFIIQLNRTYVPKRRGLMNRAELYVKNFYHSIGIEHPFNLSINKMSDLLEMSIIYWPYTSEITYYKGVYKIFINGTLNFRKQWQDFGHEMYHYFYDRVSYDLLNESYADYGESKADYFSYHFCVPTFMLENLKGVDVYKIMNLFNVEEDFAFRRLEMYQNKLISRRNIVALQKN